MTKRRRYLTFMVPIIIIDVIQALENYLCMPLGRIYCHALNMLYDHFKSGRLSLHDLTMLYAEGRDDYRAKRFLNADEGHPTFDFGFTVNEDVWKKEKELMDLLGVEYGEKSAFRWFVLRYMIKKDFNLTMILTGIEADALEIHPLWKKYVR